MMKFGLLGTVALWRGDGEIRLATKRSKAVMARLLLSPGRLVSLDSLVDGLYGESPAKSARNQVHRGVGELRKHRVAVVERDGSYLLDAGIDAVDAWRFRDLIERAGSAARPAFRAELLRAALKLWRGPALAGLDSEVFRSMAVEWEERRLGAVQDRIEADLAVGRHDELIPELRRLIEEHPLRERFHWQLMVACYRAGRAGESIAAYTRLREDLAEELGIDPSLEVRRLYEQILRQEPVMSAYGTGAHVQHGLSGYSSGAHGPVPRQIPRRPVRIAGRGAELRRIQAALENGSRAVAITGPAGSGKTTLALEAAHRAAEMFPDGSLYSAVPADAVPSMLRALGETRVPERPDERGGRLRTLLADRRILILLENVTSAAQVRPLLPAGETCALIATGRASMASLREAVRIPLGELPPDDAWALLAGGAGAHRLAAEPEAARRVSELCGGLPLALDIAAAKLAAKPHWRVATLAARLEDRDRILGELRHDDLDARPALDAGYQALPPDARALLRLIGYYGSAELSLLEASRLLEVTLEEAEELIEALIDARVVTVPGVGDGLGATYRCGNLVLAHARARALAEDPIAELDAAVIRALAAVLAPAGQYCS
ncbi:AfsR/SARP family transcriptional regulator [Nonomuraea zeae]|uniref:AfsR/SARP family transcriptional regulator n=1 Tax=Nonomuraea zeae TaxID=1642303 RepID=A0A5S4G9M8_9ACTN|nr:BTAD domain-containing putative transcriptional regulator [Nonomuraea zeae]TMR29653.1 hypothetical protein ETD85_31650 [Nonomuraea zeae]